MLNFEDEDKKDPLTLALAAEQSPGQIGKPAAPGMQLPKFMSSDEIDATRADQDSSKKWNSVLGNIGDLFASRNSAGNYFLGKLNDKQTAGGKLAEQLNAGMVDPGKRQSELYQNYHKKYT
jgi:hypothetical protein